MVKFNRSILTPIFGILGLKAPAAAAPTKAQKLYNYFKLADGRIMSKAPKGIVVCATIKAPSIQAARIMWPQSV